MADLTEVRASVIQQIARLRQEGSSRELAFALRDFGELCRKLRDPATALSRYEESVAILRGLPADLKLAHTVRHLGDIHREAGRIAQAEPCYDEALSLYRAHPKSPLPDLANAIRSMALLQGL